MYFNTQLNVNTQLKGEKKYFNSQLNVAPAKK